jgi:hypothetical protein
VSFSSIYNALIFDTDHVLLPVTTTSVSTKKLKDILSSPTWFEYERGRISQEVCYERVGQALSLTPASALVEVGASR